MTERTSGDPEFQSEMREHQKRFDRTEAWSGYIDFELGKGPDEALLNIQHMAVKDAPELGGKPRISVKVMRQSLSVWMGIHYLRSLPLAGSGTWEQDLELLLKADAESNGEHISRHWFRRHMAESERIAHFVDAGLREAERLLAERLPGFFEEIFLDAIRLAREAEEASSKAGKEGLPIPWRTSPTRKKRGGSPTVENLVDYIRVRARSMRTGETLDAIFLDHPQDSQLRSRYYRGEKLYRHFNEVKPESGAD